jgi:deoxyhypusine synthase
MNDQSTESRAVSNRKAELLSSEVEHIDIKTFDARPLIDAMGKMSFTSRDLARATRIYNDMLGDNDCTVFLVIAGSTSAAGCMDLYAELVRNNMVDGIVATGATIVDMDFFEGLGHKHYQALEIPDDDTLRSLYIDRIYDTYIDEEELQHVDHTIFEIAETLEPKAYSAARSSARWASTWSSTARRRTAWSSSPTSMTCRSSARRSPTARPALAWSSTRSMR